MIVVQVTGRLGKDAETRFTASGLKVTTLTLATNVRKSGKEETVWWRVTIWGERFDKLLPYLKKGSAVIVVGEMGKPEIWTDKEGKPQVSLEMTAEIIRFNPYSSSPERSNQEHAHAAGQQAQHHASHGEVRAEQGSASYRGGFADAGFQGTQQGQHSTGYAQQQTEEEDSLPF